MDLPDNCAVAFEERKVASPSVAFLSSQAVTVLGSVLKDVAQSCFNRASGVLDNGSSIAKKERLKAVLTLEYVVLVVRRTSA